MIDLLQDIGLAMALTLGACLLITGAIVALGYFVLKSK